MKRFRFRLERVLAVRQVEEELARAALMEREFAVRRAEQRLGEARGTLARALDELTRSLESRVLDPDALLLESGAVDGLQRRIPPARRRVQAAQQLAERERRAWNERRSALEGLKKLREHALRAHREAEAFAEARISDETALARAARAARKQS